MRPPQLLLIAATLQCLGAVCAELLAAADISRCPRHQQYFQKILGYRPDFQLIGNTHELLPTTTTTTLSPDGNDINATAFSHDMQQQPRRDAINADCWQRCSEAPECAGYVLFVNVSQCFGVTQHNRTSKFYTPLRSSGLLLDSNSVYFEKICMGNGECVCVCVCACTAIGVRNHLCVSCIAVRDGVDTDTRRHDRCAMNARRRPWGKSANNAYLCTYTCSPSCVHLTSPRLTAAPCNCNTLVYVSLVLLPLSKFAVISKCFMFVRTV